MRLQCDVLVDSKRFLKRRHGNVAKVCPGINVIRPDTETKFVQKFMKECTIL